MLNVTPASLSYTHSSATCAEGAGSRLGAAEGSDEQDGHCPSPQGADDLAGKTEVQTSHSYEPSEGECGELREHNA